MPRCRIDAPLLAAGGLTYFIIPLTLRQECRMLYRKKYKICNNSNKYEPLS